MARRDPRTPSPAPRRRGSRPVPDSESFAPEPEDIDAAAAAWVGERLRRLALGGTAALVVARALWPGEPDYRVEAGTGLAWDLAVLVVAGLALAASLIGGRLRLRWSWADAGVVAGLGLVALASGHAVDRRPAYNQAWEWAALATVYLLARNLPRTRAESASLVAALAATAVAVAAYGLYWVGVELPQVRARFLANPVAALQVVGIEPGTPQAGLFRDRLLGSSETVSTFGLANSLAGFLVGPFVVMLALAWDNLTRREGRGSRPLALATGLLPLLTVAVCLMLTKSRSSWVGLAVAGLFLAWRERNRLPRRVLAGALGLALLAAIGLAAAGFATGRLDTLVLSESGKSFRYRWEYWVGTWHALTADSRAFFWGFGPGNFSAPYLLHKLPQASEEIRDPHNFVLEVWASGGLVAVAALGFGLILAFRNLLAGHNGAEALADDREGGRRDTASPPAGGGWVVGAGALGFLAAMPPLGRLNPFEGDLFFRWLMLLVAWVLTVALGSIAWGRRPLSSLWLGAGALAVFVNLLAAGGIGIPAVAAGVWVLVAAGLNLAEGRGCATLHDREGRTGAFVLAVVWVAALGTFLGQTLPYWKAESLIESADRVLAQAQRSPAERANLLDRTEYLLELATMADRLSWQPWQKLAGVQFEVWNARGARTGDLRWKRIPLSMKQAVTIPRATNSWSRHRDRAVMSQLLIKKLVGNLPPRDLLPLRADATQASRRAAQLYPTNATLQARLAEASAEIGMLPDAVKAAREALRLDALTPHRDRKLDAEVRNWLVSHIPDWEKAAAGGVAPDTPAKR